MSFVVVIAKPGSGEAPKVYRGKDVLKVLNRIRVEHARNIISWNDNMDAFIRENYRAKGAAWVARELKVTKNAVIGRYHRIKNNV